MDHGNGVVAGESLPATAPDETAGTVPCHLYPAQDVVQDRGVNGKAGEAWTKAQMAKAESAVVEAEAKAKSAVAKAKSKEAKAKSAVAKAKSKEAKARKANAEALEAEAKAKAAVAEADAKAKAEVAKARVAEAEATTKVRVAAAEALEADLKIVKLRKELEILTGECEVKEFCVFCLSARLSVCLSLPVFLTRFSRKRPSQ